MTETIKSILPYLFNECCVGTLVITVFPRNDASRRVAIKSGFIFKGLEREHGITGCDELVDVEVYMLTKEEYEYPGTNKLQKEDLRIIEKQKWINLSKSRIPSTNFLAPDSHLPGNAPRFALSTNLPPRHRLQATMYSFHGDSRSSPRNGWKSWSRY